MFPIIFFLEQMVQEDLVFFRKRYTYAQKRIEDGHLPVTMDTSTLQILIASNYFQRNTSHILFANRDLTFEASAILIACNKQYHLSAGYVAIRHNLPPLRRLIDEDAPLEPEPHQDEPQEEAELQLLQFSLPRRRLGDYSDVIGLVVEHLE